MGESKVPMTKAQEIALEAAKTAIREFKADERKAKKKRAFQNTNLLLEHYYDLQGFTRSAVFHRSDTPYETDEAGENLQKIIEEVSGEEITVKSIKRSRELTMIMISHVDTALEQLRKKCEANRTEDRYTVIDMLHLDPTLQELEWAERLKTVCDELDKSESTVRRWRSEMVSQLGIYLFGLDGLKLVD